MQQLPVWDLRSYAAIQTVWGETKSYQFLIDYRYHTGTTTKTGPMDSTANSNCSERVNSGFRRATKIVAVDIIFTVISLRNLKTYIFLGDSLSKVVEVLTLQFRLL
jgi:hypothetical protein